ncbi:hypothetical protein LXL04_008740 [Taraxacum kok-saghyz]
MQSRESETEVVNGCKKLGIPNLLAIMTMMESHLYSNSDDGETGWRGGSDQLLRESEMVIQMVIGERGGSGGDFG